MSHDESVIALQVPTVRFQNWPPAQSLPVNPVVRLRFRGLLAFCYNQQGWFEVAFHRADGNHMREVQVYENSTLLNLPIPANITTMSVGIRVNGQDKPANVQFLKDSSADRDFRWALDLESTEFYPEIYPKNSNAVFTARLLVRHGTFYTVEKTHYALDRITRSFPFIDLPWETGWNREHLDHPAKIIGADITITANEYVSLVINDQEVVRLPRFADRIYDVDFSNECKYSNPQCRFKWDDWRESKRNDFHFHRDVVSLPVTRDRYGLVLTKNQIQKGGKHEDDKQNTDEAPCMGGGWGGTNGFPLPS